MPGLVVCSWSDGKSERAHQLFQRLCTGFERSRGIERTDEETGPSYMLARFAGDKSPYPGLIRSGDGRVVMGIAGWCFDPERPGADWRSAAEELSAKPPGDGERFIDRLQGQYAVGVTDREKGEIIVAGDQIGAYPLYTAEQDGIAWASTSAIALAYALRPRLDVVALRALFMDDAIRSPQSAFEGIRRSRFGERHYLEAGGVHTRRVWDPFRETRAYGSFDDAVDEGISILQASCRRVEETWPRCVSDLTSGLDSRLLVAAMASNHEPVHTTVNGSPLDRDVIVARRIAEKFKWPLLHNEYPDDWGRTRWRYFQRGVALADGEKPGHAIDGTIWAKSILRGSYDAATGGQGGEFLRDFLWQQDYPRIGRTSNVNVKRLVRLMFTFSSNPDISLFRHDWRTEYENTLLRSIREILNLAPDALNTVKLDAVYLWRQSGHYGRYGGSTFPVIASPLPLMTGDVFAYSVALPWRYRIKGRLVRHLITRLHPQLASMPTWHGGAAEPLTLRRPIRYAEYYANLAAKVVRKLGRLAFKSSLFAPPTARHTLPEWDRDFVGVLAKEGLLSVENLVTRELYDTAYLKEFVRRATEDGFKGFPQLYTIVSIESICRFCEIAPEGQSF